MRSMTTAVSGRTRASPLLSTVVAAVLALGIFAVDTFTTFRGAIAVLYVVVVLMAANLFKRRGLLLVSAGCLALTIASFSISHGFAAGGDALVRCLMSLSAIGITTILALANQSTTMMLRDQAELLDLTHDAVLVRDMENTVTYWNRGAEELYGWQRADVVGRSSHDLLRTVLPAPLESINRELVRTGRWEGDLIHRKRDGSQVLVSSRWALQKDEDGRPVAVLETNTNITERSQAQEALHRAEAQLAHVARVTTLGELTASIAHEVNQPLAAIVTNGEACLRWLNREPPELDEARSAVNRSVEAARRASEVISHLRALARKSVSERVRLDIADVINEVVLLVQRECVRERVALHVDLPATRLTAVGDRVQLQQVIMNLLINGIQAIAAANGRRRDLWVRASLQQDGREVAVSVEDSGIGLSPGDETRMFEAFFTTKPEGMGMGLSISRSIIESHGGRISASANAGAGATVRFTLPVDEEPADRQRVPA